MASKEGRCSVKVADVKDFWTPEIGKKEIKILAIESSCDETAAAVVKNGREVLADEIISSATEHARFGGVVP